MYRVHNVNDDEKNETITYYSIWNDGDDAPRWRLGTDVEAFTV